MRTLLLLMAVAMPVWGEFQLFTVSGTVETPVPAVYHLGATRPGDTLEVRFRLRNTSTAAVTLRPVTIAGPGFSLFGQPMSQPPVAAGSNVDFSVRFTAVDPGPYAANLTVNGRITMLTATVAGSTVVTLDGQLLAAGATIEFGILERGQSLTRRVKVENRTTSTLALDDAAASGAGFSVAAPALPAPIPANGSLAVDVTCKPEKAGFLTGSLSIDGRQYRLAVLANEPKAPRPAIAINGTVRSGEQIAIEVPLAETSRANATGTLTVELRAPTRDDAVVFTASGRKTISFEVREGDRKAQFGSGERTLLQTGTTAGTLVVKGELGGYTEQFTMVIAPEIVRVDSGRATREGRNLVVQLNAFDNTRTLSRLAYTFYDAKGAAINANPVVPDVTADFRRYFDGSTLGGAFGVKAVFPVTGDPAQVSAVEVELKNDTGVTRTGRLAF
ncbi:MAG TPA: choice-of-anchor D domain-containing protein [Bryobacteraceae bacterium]|nr:choice-of-anchor D domain-containing protein [Bryobacteraceae bacterium]